MALFVLRKLILQTRMCSHPVGLDVWFLVGPFVYFHTSCVRTAKALARLRPGSPEHSMWYWVPQSHELAQLAFFPQCKVSDYRKWYKRPCKVLAKRSKWAASSEFGTYSLCEQRRFRRACASAQSRQKLQASLRIRAVSPEPSLLAHTSSESRGTFRQKTRSLAPLNGWTCAVEICHDGMLEDTNSLDGAQIVWWKK